MLMDFYKIKLISGHNKMTGGGARVGAHFLSSFGFHITKKTKISSMLSSFANENALHNPVAKM